MEFELGPGRRAAVARTPPRAAMRLLIVGDFSARPAAERPPLAERRTHRVDHDNLDAVVARLAPRLALAGGEVAGGEVAFASLDDFHPDALYRRLPLFQSLRDARAQPPQAGGDLLGALLGKTAAAPAAAPSTATPASGIDAFIHAVVAPHIVADTSAATRSYQAAVDAAIGEQMRTLLHDPALQALEAGWRGVHWLISSLELDETLQLHLFDAGRDELIADVVAAQGQLARTGLHQALADRWHNVPGGESWSLVAGLYGFGPSDADIGLLAALGLVARESGGPFVAAGDMALANEPPFAGWQALRRSEAAPSIGLVAPRVLLRRPYDKRSDPIDAFAFEEFAAAPRHEDFLWGNGALAVALLLGRGYAAQGWDFEPGDERQINDLPACTVDVGGEPELQACAEHHLGDEAGDRLLAAGLMPLMSHRHANAVTLLRLRSIAEPPAALAGF